MDYVTQNNTQCTHICWRSLFICLYQPRYPRPSPLTPPPPVNHRRNNRDISLLFCKARYYELHNDFTNAQSELNQLVAMRPGFVPPLVEKMKVSMAMLDWDQSVDMMNRWVETDDV